MDPDHRDRVAMLRICSGKFASDASTTHVRTGKKLRLSKSSLVMGRAREQVEEAYPGDVVALFDPGIFRIGDTVSDEGSFAYAGIPSFSPELFTRVEVAEVKKRKALEKGLAQLSQEGAVQLFYESGTGTAVPILGAVGSLQFDVLKHRMATEYRVELTLTSLPFTVARWIRSEFDPEWFRYGETLLLDDREGHPVVISKSEWYMDRLLQRHEDLDLAETATS